MYITRFPSENVYFSRFSMAVFWWKSSLLFWKRFWTLGESARSDPNDSSYIKTLYFYSVHTLLTGVVSKDIVSGFRTSCFQSSQLAHPVPLVQHLWIKTPEQLDQSSGWHHHIWGKMRTKKKNTFCICTHRQQSLLSVRTEESREDKKRRAVTHSCLYGSCTGPDPAAGLHWWRVDSGPPLLWWRWCLSTTKWSNLILGT